MGHDYMFHRIGVRIGGVGRRSIWCATRPVSERDRRRFKPSDFSRRCRSATDAGCCAPPLQSMATPPESSDRL